MPADSIHPDQPCGGQRFRADLAGYLDSLLVHELGERYRFWQIAGKPDSSAVRATASQRPSGR
jgi:hypothetical protein